MNITDILEVKANPNIPALAPGDTVRVRQKVVEGEKTRIQVFQGVVIQNSSCRQPVPILRSEGLPPVSVLNVLSRFIHP